MTDGLRRKDLSVLSTLHWIHILFCRHFSQGLNRQIQPDLQVNGRARAAIALFAERPAAEDPALPSAELSQDVSEDD